MKQNAKGFTACGQFYSMDDPDEDYIECCKRLLKEIRKNKLKHNEKAKTQTTADGKNYR